MMSPGPMLAPLPISFCAQGMFSQGIHQEPANQDERSAAKIYQLAASMFQSACQRLDQASGKLENAAECMNALTKALLDMKNGEQLIAHRANKDVPEADTIGASYTLDMYDKTRRTVREFALWFLENATVDELKGPWIQFADSPRGGVDGVYLRDWLTRDVGLEDQMGFAIARLLKKGELKKRGEPKNEADSEGRRWFLLHDWAAKALEQDSTADDCLHLFDRQKRNYKLTECNKTVSYIRLGEKWISLWTDIVRKTTLLIHPTASARPLDEVMQEFKPMCQHLTYMALSNMATMSKRTIDSDSWSFDVALKNEHPMEPNNGGVVTFYYSIPKENQFAIVSEATIENAKQTFIHETVKMCHALTKKKVQKGFKKKSKLKRKNNGKFRKVLMMQESSEGSVDVSCTPSGVDF